MHALEGLNEQQQRAAGASAGPVLIVAGPGTGKTKTLTARIAFLLESGQAKPNEILALTFTNKAAREMRGRLSSLLEPNVRIPKIGTFHAFGHKLLRLDTNDIQLIQPSEQQGLIRTLQRPKPFMGLSVHELTLVISRAKTVISGTLDNPTTQLLQQYHTALQAAHLYDFDDLLVKTFETLRDDEAKRSGYPYVLVDEFQDTSNLQYEILKLLSGGENIFAIGDPNQSIYAFRGAGAEMFAQFRADYPQVTEIALTKNYRSRPEIITVANAIFPYSPQLEAHQKTAGTIQVIQTLNEYSEATYVLGEVEHGIGGSSFLNANSQNDVREPRDYAVLYRTHQAGRVLQKAFAEAGVPYQIAGEGSPYARPEVQSVIAALRAADSTSNLPVATLAENIAMNLGVSVDALRQFLNVAVQFGNDVAACLQHIDDIAEQEFYDPSVNAVTLMTIHASKGLEFSHVFLIAAEEGVLPKGEDIEEEQRLLYVAVTRAKEAATILHTKVRVGRPTTLSRFVAKIPAAMLPQNVDPDLPALEKRLQKRARKRAQTSLF